MNERLWYKKLLGRVDVGGTERARDREKGEKRGGERERERNERSAKGRGLSLVGEYERKFFSSSTSNDERSCDMQVGEGVEGSDQLDEMKQEIR